MLNVSQATSLLQSLGVTNTTATKAAEQAASSGAGGDAVNFLKALQESLEKLSGVGNPAQAIAPAQPAQATAAAQQAQAASGPMATKPAVLPKAPFGNFEEYKTWEKGLGQTYPPNYKAPDYIRAMGLSMSAGEDEMFNRYVFFKNNPQYAIDYEGIRSGTPSRYPTDGSTLIKSDLSSMPTETADFYRKNPDALRMAEGFNFDPTLFKMQLDGKLPTQPGVNTTEWLAQNKWTAGGPVANDNRATLAQADYVGINGTGAGTYRLARMDPGTGRLVDLDGKGYDSRTGTQFA